MSKPKILIVGCGAVGLTQGYYLSFGADITYLVRPGRAPAFQAPRKLYEYKENVLNVFDNYRVVESTSKLAGEEFDFVFDTLDGHTARSEGGRATLKAVGDLIRARPATFVVYDAVGLDMEDHYAQTMGIAKDRLIMAASMLAHQPTTSISLPAAADRDLASQADILYTYLTPNVGLIAVNTQPKLSKALESFYSKNGKVKLQIVPAFFGIVGALLSLVQILTWNIEDYQPFPQFRKNQELWNLMMKAQVELLNLPRFGWSGWLMSWVMGSWATTKLFTMPIDGAVPLQLHEFNAFHHGMKVVKQDIELLEDIVADGKRNGQKMAALTELIRRVEVTEAKKAEARASSESGGAATAGTGVTKRR